MRPKYVCSITGLHLALTPEAVRLWRKRWLAFHAIALSDLLEISADQVCQIQALECEQPKERPISR